MITAYKKGRTFTGDPALITLYVDRNAQNNMLRTVGNRDMMMAKHRCERCYVGEIVNLSTGAKCLEAESFNAPAGQKILSYRPGEVVKSERYDDDENKICSDGIHYFLSMDRAITYKSPFYNHLFRVWFDNGLPRYIAQTNRTNEFHGLFVEYNREGRIAREILVQKNTVTQVIQYSWKPLIVQRFPPKSVNKMFRERLVIHQHLKIENLVPGIKSFLTPTSP